MKYTAVRRIYFHSAEAGLVAKDVAKEIESQVPPQIGYRIDDSAWLRNDQPKIEDVEIHASTGACTVQLESKKMASAEAVQQLFEVILSHDGWKEWR
jgi:hypothetical protein